MQGKDEDDEMDVEVGEDVGVQLGQLRITDGGE